MKRCITGAIVYALLLGSVVAADPAYILRDDGLYVLQPDAMALVKVAFVDQRTGAPGPDPGPGPTPTPEPQDVTTRVKQAAETTQDKTGALLVARVYREAAATPGQTRESYLGYVKEGTERALGLTGTLQKWIAARAIISGIITEKEAAGRVNYPTLFNEIAAGLEQAGGIGITNGPQQAIEALEKAIPNELLIMLFNILLDLLRKWFFGG